MAAPVIHMSSHWLVWDKQKTGRWWCEERRFLFKLRGSARDIKPPFVIISQDHVSSSHIHIGQLHDPSTSPSSVLPFLPSFELFHLSHAAPMCRLARCGSAVEECTLPTL